MADISVTALKVEQLRDARTRDVVAGGPGNVGDVVYIDGTSGAKPADASALATSLARGVVVAVAGGKDAFVSGDMLTIVIDGPVAGFTGMTPGAVQYLSETAGKMADTAPSRAKALGWAQTASIFIVDMGADPAA